MSAITQAAAYFAPARTFAHNTPVATLRRWLATLRSRPKRPEPPPEDGPETPEPWNDPALWLLMIH